MNLFKKWFQEIDRKDISYFDVYQKISEEIRKNKKYENNQELRFEWVAFSLFWYNNLEDNPRETYYWPFSIMRIDENRVQETPWRSFITKDALNYREKRAFEEENPFLRLRYADLVFDLYKLWNIKFNYKLLDIIIDSLVESLSMWYFKNVHGRDVVKRVLDVAICSRNDVFIEKSKNAVMDLEDEIAKDNLCWMWWFSFDYLMNNKNIKLSESEEKKIIGDLLDRFNRIDNEYWLYNCVNRLTKYYEKMKDEKSLLNILLLYEEKTKSSIVNWWNGILINNYYQNLINFYLQYGHVWENIIKGRNRIILEYQQIWKNIKDSLQTFTSEINFTEEEIRQYEQEIIPNDKDIKYHMISISHIPVLNIDKLKKELDVLYKKYPLLYLSEKVFYDGQWLPVSTVGGIEEDYDWNLYSYMGQIIQFQWILLDVALNKFLSIHKKEEVVKNINKCFIFDEIDKILINNIIDNYYKAKYWEVNYQILPLIERTFRKVIQRSGWQIITIKKNSNCNNEISYISLDGLLKNKILESIFWKDSVVSFRIVLTEKLWFNLRNIMAHWLDDYGILLKKYTSDILISILFYLSLLEEKK